MTAIVLLIALLAAGNTEATAVCGRKLDLLVVADGSETICGGPESCPRWNSVLDFIKDFVRSFKIGPSDTKVAFIKVSDKFYTEWNLDRYPNETSLLSAIDNVKYPGGEYTTYGSTVILVTEIFNIKDGDRLDALNVLMMVTDGLQSVNVILEELASAFYQEATIRPTVFVVCVTPGCTESLAHSLASPPKQASETYFLVNGYFSLAPVLGNLVEKVCSYKTLVDVLTSGK